MRLPVTPPVWMIGKYFDVIYVYKNDIGELMMEVYKMDGNRSFFMGVQPCDHDLEKLEILPSPKKEMMERRRKKRVAANMRNLGQQSLF